MKLYGGIDLHSNNSVVVLLDENDAVIDRQPSVDQFKWPLTPGDQ
ncbi:hypothetical protein [Thiorhodococcus fuscus]|uniref:IS110 family transposase n=1 Tax=Thiorhodococcus fuscus TaxID=527200 RepID=A0ABW4YBA6_9GAMM